MVPSVEKRASQLGTRVGVQGTTTERLHGKSMHVNTKRVVGERVQCSVEELEVKTTGEEILERVESEDRHEVQRDIRWEIEHTSQGAGQAIAE